MHSRTGWAPYQVLAHYLRLLALAFSLSCFAGLVAAETLPQNPQATYPQERSQSVSPLSPCADSGQRADAPLQEQFFFNRRPCLSVGGKAYRVFDFNELRPLLDSQDASKTTSFVEGQRVVFVAALFYEPLEWFFSQWYTGKSTKHFWLTQPSGWDSFYYLSNYILVSRKNPKILENFIMKNQCVGSKFGHVIPFDGKSLCMVVLAGRIERIKVAGGFSAVSMSTHSFGVKVDRIAFIQHSPIVDLAAEDVAGIIFTAATKGNWSE